MPYQPFKSIVEASVMRFARLNVIEPLSILKSTEPPSGIGYAALENGVALFASVAFPSPMPARTRSFYQ
jgi:hypothetical protein